MRKNKQISLFKLLPPLLLTALLIFMSYISFTGGGKSDSDQAENDKVEVETPRSKQLSVQQEGEDSSGNKQAKLDVKDEDNESKGGAVIAVEKILTVEQAAKLSPREWTPPAPFMRVIAVTPQKHYQRGQNLRRYYESPKIHKVDSQRATDEPGIMAGISEDERLHLLPEEIDLHTLIARRMVFDSSALDSVIAGKTSQIITPTTQDEVLTIDIHSFKTRSNQSHTLFGRVAGEEETSEVQFVYHDGILHGTVSRYKKNQHLEYRILADGHMMVREIDQQSMTALCGNGAHTEGIEGHKCNAGCNHGPNAEELLEKAAGQDLKIIPQNQEKPLGDTAGWTTVDVVVGYGQAARMADGGYSQIEARIISAIDRMSDAFANSLITNTEMNLLGTIEDPDYLFPGPDVVESQDSELYGLDDNSDGVLDTVSDYATLLGADFVSFVTRESDGSAGLAFRPGSSSITARDYIAPGRMTFAHELGHNLGCDHSWGDSSQSYKSSYGWRLDIDGNTATTNDQYRTIMAYDWGWGTRLVNYSNPAVSYPAVNGAPTGAPYGHDVRTDTRGDQRYYQSGYNYSNGVLGFDGTNAGLAANNADTILNGTGRLDYGATYASNRSTRVANEVLNPIATTNWVAGSTGNIFFVGGDHTDTATLDLYKGGVHVETIVTGLNPATSRDYDWATSASLVTGSDYQIRVTLSHSEGGSTSFNSANFTITALDPNTILVSSPNGGETIAIGELREITWVSNVTGNVNIELLKGGATVSVLAVNETNDGSYIWNVSAALVPGTDYQIKIISSDNASYFDESDANFEIVESSLAVALDTTGLTWSTSGDVPWFYQTATTNDGVDAAQSGAITDSQTSSMETTLAGPGTLTFFWKVSSEDTYDFLEFYINDNIQTGDLDKISGEVPWTQKTVSIPAGNHTIKWSYEKDFSVDGGSDTAWVDQVVFTPSGNTVTYNGNGNDAGTVPVDTNQYADGALVTAKTNSGNLAKTGFVFVGWNTQANGNGTTYLQNASFNIGTSDITLYAKWNALPTYTISYNGNGNTEGNPPPDQTKTEDIDIMLSGPGSLTKAGFTFTEWNTLANGNGTSYSAGEIYGNNANVTLYAQWSPTTYTVTYDGNGSTAGSVPVDNNDYNNNDVVNVLGEGNLVRPPYTFSSWNTASDGSGTEYNAGNTFTITSNVTLYAQWNPGPLVIYEPFDDANSTLAGNTPGLGLTGTWSGNGTVSAGNLSFGDLPASSGNKAVISNKNGNVLVDNTLATNGLLSNGSTLWFSVLVKTGRDIATNGDFGFAFGSETLNSGNNIPIANSGQALGFTFKNNQLRASHWIPNTLTRSTTNNNNGAGPNTLYLVVGKITWGTTSDTIEIYNVPANLTRGATANSTYTTNFDQSIIDTISFGSKSANPSHEIDEIRVGSTYEAVIGLGSNSTLDHFAISPISSNQTVGVPITGITITAQDSNNETVTDFTGTVTYGGTAGITGESANFVNGVLTGVSLTPTNIGIDRTLTVTDGDGHDGLSTFNVLSLYDTWSGSIAHGTDTNGDGISNGLAWLFGATDPNADATGLMPTIEASATHFIFTYRRSDDANTSPDTSIAMQYGMDLAGWTEAVSGPNITIIEADNFYRTPVGNIPGVDKVEVRINLDLAPNGLLFGRVKLAITSP